MKHEEKKKDNRSVGEKIDDALDTTFDVLEDITMGPKKDFQSDIPATFYTGNDTRKVNKIQTRKNINKKILGKNGAKIIFIVIAIGLVISLVYYLVEMLLMK